MKKKKNYRYLIFIIIIIIIIIYISNICYDFRIPRRVYMPDMYYSEAYEPYSFSFLNKQNKFSIFKKSTSLIPVQETISRNDNNIITYNIINTKKGYEKSKKITTSPFSFISENKRKDILERGKNIYNINCAICHGESGDGEGFLVKKEKILGVPSYKNIPITIGSVYYVIMYGKNNMGSYSSQISLEDRWKVAEYVLKLKNHV